MISRSGQVVERLAHERVEVVRVVRVELQELALVGLGGEVLARQLLRADHEALELGLVLGVLVVGELGDDQADRQRRDRARR